MWPRVVEVMLGLWLVLSPFVFRHPDGEALLWASDLFCGVAVIVFGLLSFWSRAPAAHLATLAVALWLTGFGWAWGGHPALPGYQNDILVGLTLALFAIIPNDAAQPPGPWRDHYQKQADVDIGRGRRR